MSTVQSKNAAPALKDPRQNSSKNQSAGSPIRARGTRTTRRRPRERQVSTAYGQGFPLPQGEGQGEGEGSAPFHRVRISTRPSLTPALSRWERERRVHDT